MTDLLLNYPKQEAEELIVEAFERTDGISEIDSSGFQVTGKTGLSFPRVLWSYGEAIYVDLSESEEEGQTPITIRGEKKVAINIGANPEKFKRQFIQNLNDLR